MKVILQTACGCTRMIDIPDASKGKPIEVPLAEAMGQDRFISSISGDDDHKWSGPPITISATRQFRPFTETIIIGLGPSQRVMVYVEHGTYAMRQREEE